MPEKSTFEQLREDEREVRKRLIIEAAMELFEEKSFHEIGMRDIALKAGVSAASIYRYFPSRDDLFVEALIRDINNIEKRLRDRVDNGGNMEELAIAVVDYLVENEATFQMMVHFMIRGELNPQALKKFNSVQRYFLKMFSKVVEQTDGSEQFRLNAQAFFASLAGVVLTYRNYPGRTAEEKRKAIHRLALMIMHQGEFNEMETD
ncbi:AcrR family transcriptional regulator [Desulfosalsimonas propionicica]|uniref:AcrR family transcriptional regulator n=1 Tax=Desulfosalsimonas propionicica TaxID=332175 RepID=A0A7W0C7I8_9BACT|nr:TetR/AcrR family transcriptional regulator [Desulfosalsimonas propionicica]MBA2880618.1 AcrR family transcriptional regulator [Desulfosalsimonas propionicica]